MKAASVPTYRTSLLTIPPLQIFAKEVMEKVKLLDNEKMKTEKAFHDFLPKSIVKELKQKRVRSLSLTQRTKDCIISYL